MKDGAYSGGKCHDAVVEKSGRDYSKLLGAISTMISRMTRSINN